MGMMNMFNPFIGGGASEDKIARAEIAAIKDGETLDSFSDVENALANKADIADIPTVPITTIQKNGTNIIPVEGTVNIIVPTTAADVSALPDTTKYATTLSLTINSQTFVMTGQLKDQNGNNLGAAQTIDLPLESVVVDGSYDSQTKEVVLTLQSGNTVEFSVADLVSGLQTELSENNKLNPVYINYDSTHRAVSDTEKSAWNGKQSALTTEQLAAVNSGIDSIKVAQIEINKNNIAGIKDGTDIDSFSDVEAALSNKVDKETGKGLSTNDYTTVEKTKLAGIAEGAEVNIQSDWNQVDNSKDDYIKNKPTIPTTASEISYDNTTSHLEATNTQAAIDELAAITYPSINITADSGAIITATNGAIILTATMEQTPLKMLIPSYGKWTFSASLNGKVISKIINFTTSKIYDVELTFDNVYGVEWGLTGQTLSRTGAAAEFINPVPYVNNGMSAEDCSSPFDNLYPWNGMIRETVDGNEVVKIPKFWYKIEKTNSKLSIQIADAPRTGFNVSPAHRARGSYPEQDYVYIGRYHSDSNYKSTSGVIPIANITRATARTNQAAIGSGYHQLDFSLWITIWMLYLVEFANWNTQLMIGYNCGNNSSKENTGSTDAMLYHTGTMQASKTTYGTGVQYRYIEDPWGNVVDWCDGITFGPDENNNTGEGIYCFEDFENYSDSYSASGAVLVGRRANVSNYIQDFDQSNVSGFDWVLYPGNGDTASSQNQIPDYCYFNASGVVLCVGGYYNRYASLGLFYLGGSHSASYQGGSIGVRLQKIPSTN